MNWNYLFYYSICAWNTIVVIWFVFSLIFAIRFIRQGKNIDPITLAQQLHEAGRSAVTSGCTVYAEKDKGENAKKFIEWDDLSEPAKLGRQMQATFLTRIYSIKKKL